LEARLLGVLAARRPPVPEEGSWEEAAERIVANERWWAQLGEPEPGSGAA
jgi:hypothetical protein